MTSPADHAVSSLTSEIVRLHDELDRLRAQLAQPVIVTIYSDNDTAVDAPDGVRVEIRYEIAADDVLCSCGIPLYTDDYGLTHREGYGFGDDHDPNPTPN